MLNKIAFWLRETTLVISVLFLASLFCKAFSISRVRTLNVAAQKSSGRPKKTWEEVVLDDRRKLGIVSTDPQNRSEWRGRLRSRPVAQVQPSVEENGL